MVAAPASPPPTTVSPNNGMVNLGIYSIISAAYLLIDYNSDAMHTGVIFVIIIWFTQFIMTFIALQRQCNTPNYWLAAWASTVTWLVLFVPLFGCLEYMYDWLRPFGNTFGYFMMKLNGLVQFMDSILLKSGTDEIQKYLDYMQEDPWALFSMLTTYDNAPKMERAGDKFDELSNGYLNASIPDAKTTFVNYVRLKESVAKFIFYVIALNLMADITFIITQEHKPCITINDTVLNPTIAATTPTTKPAIVYKTSE